MSSPVDEAFDRCEILSRILARARIVSLADPTHSRNQDLGLTEPGDTKATARRKIETAFDAIEGLVNHVAVLDMAASFEALFRARLGNALGEARALLRDEYREKFLFMARESLAARQADFEGLGGLERLLGPYLSGETAHALREIRNARNEFTHGTDIRRAPSVTRDQVLSILNEIAARL